VLSYSLKVEPATHFINWQQDPQGNYLARLVFPEPTREFSVEVDLVAEMAVFNPFDFFLEPSAEKFPFAYEPNLAVELAPFLRKDPLDDSPAFAAFVRSIDPTPKPTVDFLVALNLRINQAVRYVIRLEPGVQSPEETLTKALGSCRDSGWLLVQTLRHLGLAARFVSGYLIQLRADVKALDGPSGTAEDFTDLHAWCEVYLPGAGWIGLDPTSGLLAGEGHLPLACSPEPSSAAPITGVVEKSECTFEFAMKVTRIRESPRVTFPFTDETWSKVDALGERVDAMLRASDVRLTMGGEPTFISIDDMDGPEWNTAALGPRKRELAGQLFKRMASHFAAGGFVHHGQGKWYPGEPLPRWALSCVWRRDHKSLWQNPALLADPTQKSSFTNDDAKRFAAALATRLGVGEERLVPGYEDTFYYLWKERRLPVGFDPLKKDVAKLAERDRIAQMFEERAATPTGYALPLLREFTTGKWVSSPWFFRAGRMYLLPGDSPMGLRLPLEQQPWFSAGTSDAVSAPKTDLPAGAPKQPFVAAAKRPVTPATPPAPVSLGNPDVRIALCVETRDGCIHIFMPPAESADDYLSLLSMVEATAAALAFPVVIEGYLPPYDPQLSSFRVTPDPGVIEVNIHPSSSWRELVEKMDWLYAAARECRLGTDKFMVDGRHTGTGGGNHLILGGATADDSPLLRRPHLLKSLIAYWHQHPSLSYLFSGLFIGPTSQSPRLDEARNDILFEIEIAFRELDRQIEKNSNPPPWLVDRIFRHLLTDITGNTHRAEFCIDKLYSPDSATGRLGLLELRAFEMPPHARMSLTQQLLLRALVSRFWDHPFEPTRLARWGTDLHDRFLLPHYVRADFADVIADLCSWGLPFEEAWFASHLEFRFPHYGEVVYRGVQLELRHALEPWHVLGEEGAAGTTVRFVDSSVERLQLKVSGFTPERYYVSVNGARVPLQPTGVKGEYVAGIRYRAWLPASALHPTIGVDNPLVFDLVDAWNQKAIGGCTYHVAHPGGRNYTTMPVNSYEAESRRLARFFPHGHTPGQPLPVLPREVSVETPHTLDLRNPYKVGR
jgi:uncharacterized protein (DUF2126 family)/transglutaminase-like putative cysteine protease